jgi:hypothetical protein
MTLLAAATLHFSLDLANGHGYKPYRLCRITPLAGQALPPASL